MFKYCVLCIFCIMYERHTMCYCWFTFYTVHSLKRRGGSVAVVVRCWFDSLSGWLHFNGGEIQTKMLRFIDARRGNPRWSKLIPPPQWLSQTLCCSATLKPTNRFNQLCPAWKWKETMSEPGLRSRYSRYMSCIMILTIMNLTISIGDLTSNIRKYCNCFVFAFWHVQHLSEAGIVLAW